MGKSLIVGAPFIIALLLLLGWGVYLYGKSVGKNEAPKRRAQASDALLDRANDIFDDLLYIDDVSEDDIIVSKTRQTLNNWQKDYRREKRL